MSKLFVSSCYYSKKDNNYVVMGYALSVDGQSWRGSGRYGFPYKVVVSEEQYKSICNDIAKPVLLDVVPVGSDSFGNVCYRLK